MSDPPQFSGKLLALLLVVSAVLLVVLFVLPTEKMVYSITVAEALERTRSDELVRVQGTLVPGSLCQVTGQCEHRLLMAERYPPDAGPLPTLRVRYGGCLIPDTLAYQGPGIKIEIVAEGELGVDGVLEAGFVAAKCPGVYRYPDETWTGGVRPAPDCP